LIAKVPFDITGRKTPYNQARKGAKPKANNDDEDIFSTSTNPVE
jgi:hypothetical protein